MNANQSAPTRAPTIVFAVPPLPGHFLPTLPVVRSLVARGSAVLYLSNRPAQPVVEAAGATYMDSVETLYRGRTPRALRTAVIQRIASAPAPAIPESASPPLAIRLHMWLELMPTLTSWLQQVSPQLVVYCPYLMGHVHIAAASLRIPTASLMTMNGPGALNEWARDIASAAGYERSRAGLDAWWRTTPDMTHPATSAAAAQLEGTYGASASELLDGPLGSKAVYSRECNLVATTERIATPWNGSGSPVERGYTFDHVGPLLTERATSVATERNAAMHGDIHDGAHDDIHDVRAPFPMEFVRAQVAAGRTLILCALGTVITSKRSAAGWETRRTDPLTGSFGATGREFARAVWSGLFAELGSQHDAHERADAAPLLVIALGPQADALEQLRPPANAICRPYIPQVDLLDLHPRLFVTHAGHNSVIESLRAGVPLVAVPRQHDQPGNAARVQTLGAGIAVPPPADGSTSSLATYTRSVRRAVRSALVQTGPAGPLTAGAARAAADIATAGGVPAAVAHLLALASP